jgi:hypothetical protein
MYAGPIDVVKQIIRKEGMLGLYTGMESTFWRFEVFYDPIYLSLLN